MQVQAYPSWPPSPAGSRQSMSIISTFLHLLLLALPIHGIDVDLDNDDSVVMTARVLAEGVRHYYTGDRPGGIPGYLPPPYYWWEAGPMFGSLIDYWFYTGDSTYNNIIIQAMLHQASETQNFMPANQTRVEGNDDQCFWALAAMAAAERRFTDPPPDQPQWLTLVQGTFNSQAARWDMETCGGGLKWQIFRFNKGFNYKNTISNGCFFNIAARLATYTNNHTYAVWAEKTWEWVQRIGLITPDYYFLDGTDDLKNCSQLNRNRWTYNAGIFMLGAAHMYQFTNGSEIWKPACKTSSTPSTSSSTKAPTSSTNPPAKPTTNAQPTSSPSKPTSRAGWPPRCKFAPSRRRGSCPSCAPLPPAPPAPAPSAPTARSARRSGMSASSRAAQGWGS
ncbi:glycosyl hydrolase [Histoplasma ohiense]|nr:glycosyl hydrolase [Histoplasma ohiense (nom. inval.)]